MTKSVTLPRTFGPRSAWLEPSADSLPAVGRALRHLLALMAERRTQRRSMSALGALENHVLKDIGVSRSEIPYLAQHGRADVVAARHRQ